MGIFSISNKKYKQYNHCRYALEFGIYDFTRPCVVDLFLNTDQSKLIIVDANDKKSEKFISFSQIFEFGEANNLNVPSQNSVGANALLGAVVFGVAGAIIGGLAGTSATKTLKQALIIKYHPTNNPEEEKDLIFEIVQASNFGSNNHSQFLKDLEKATGSTCLSYALSDQL